MAGTPISQDEDDLLALLEAARWAPSCFNAQPWRFLYAHRDTLEWPLFFHALMEINQAWAKNAGVLLAVLSRTEFEHNGNPAATHGFDAGTAWMSLALQASEMGLATHGMFGFNPQTARHSLQIPDPYAINAFIAVGHPGEIDSLPAPYREKETPSGRKPLSAIACCGVFDGARLEPG